MPKRGKAKVSTDSQVMSFHCLASAAVSSNTAAFNLSPSGLSSFSTRLAAAAD